MRDLPPSSVAPLPPSSLLLPSLASSNTKPGIVPSIVHLLDAFSTGGRGGWEMQDHPCVMNEGYEVRE